MGAPGAGLPVASTTSQHVLVEMPGRGQSSRLPALQAVLVPQARLGAHRRGSWGTCPFGWKEGGSEAHAGTPLDSAFLGPGCRDEAQGGLAPGLTWGRFVTLLPAVSSTQRGWPCRPQAWLSRGRCPAPFCGLNCVPKKDCVEILTPISS